MKSNNLAILVLVFVPMAWTEMARGQVHWGYEGKVGPQHWAELDPKFQLCGIGKNQSPIDLNDFVEADLKPIRFAYKAASQEILNNGHTIQVSYAAGSSITTESRVFELKQFHFHAPSENKTNGKQFPLEAHLVHADKDGNLAVVAVMFQEGAANALLTRLWEKMPNKAGDKSTLPTGLSVSQLLPKERDYYHFNGSLTTPPCTEGVRWFVMKKPTTSSRAQIQRFSKAIGFANNRPIQSTNSRPVLQ